MPKHVPETAIDWFLEHVGEKLDDDNGKYAFYIKLKTVILVLAFTIQEEKLVPMRLRHLLHITPVNEMGKLETLSYDLLPAGCDFR